MLGYLSYAFRACVAVFVLCTVGPHSFKSDNRCVTKNSCEGCSTPVSSNSSEKPKKQKWSGFKRDGLLNKWNNLETMEFV